MESFYARLSYSVGNEDWETEQKALRIEPADRVISVTASGDRPLNLLSQNCRELVTIDANPFQNALFDLKRAALATLDYEHYLSFLGASPGRGRVRVQTLKQLRESLTPTSFAFWERHKKMIFNGVLYQGAIEKWTARAAKIIRALRGQKKVERLFSFEEIEEQKGFVEREWNCPSWKRAFDLALHPFMTRLFLKDPGLYAHVDPSIKVSDHLYNRMTYALKHFLAKESLIISLVLNGKVYKEGYPPYLTEEGVAKIRGHQNVSSFHTTDLINYLESGPANCFDCFSLSDVASYLGREDFHKLSRAVFHAATPGARFCIRQFTSRHNFPEDLVPHFQRDLLLEERLTQEDRCFIYQFMVGKIVK